MYNSEYDNMMDYNHNHNPYETKVIDRQFININCKRKVTEDIM